MILAVAGTTDVGSLTAGLGVIAAALVLGQFLFYKFVHTPAITRQDKVMEAETQRWEATMSAADARWKAELDHERERAVRLEAKIERQNLVLEDKALPALIAATNTVSQFQSLMEELRQEQSRLAHQREIQEAIEKGKE